MPYGRESVCFNEDGEQDNIPIPFEAFRPFSWLDAMQNSFCAPGGGTIDDEGNRRENRFEIQRAFYTAYGKTWGMKSQCLYSPNENGMITNAWFCSISHNDKGMINLSGLDWNLH